MEGTSLPRDAALVLVDVQRGFDELIHARRNNPGAEAVIARLLAAWRASDRPVLHVRHHSRRPASPLRPGAPGADFKPEAQPVEGEPIFTKSVNAAFIGTDLEAHLRARGIGTIVLAGVQTNYCVESTARMAGNLGFDTYVVDDATWTYDKEGPDGIVRSAEQLHEITLVNLHGEFATITSADEVLRMLG